MYKTRILICFKVASYFDLFDCLIEYQCLVVLLNLHLKYPKNGTQGKEIKLNESD